MLFAAHSPVTCTRYLCNDPRYTTRPMNRPETPEDPERVAAAPGIGRQTVRDDRETDDVTRRTPAPGVLPGPNFLYWGGRSLYLNLTSRCSSSCTFCLRESGWECYGYDLWLDVRAEPEAVDLISALELEFLDAAPNEVVFTGIGEPTLRLDVVLAVTDWLRTRRLRTRLDTNGHGQLLNPGRSVVAELAAAGLTAASVSLNAPDEATYDALCRPVFTRAYRAVVRFIREAVDAGIDVTATVVDLPEVDREASHAVARDLGASFRVRAYVPGRKAAARPAGDA
jgi:cyclic pyranopterin phosphate synthase